MIEGEKDGTANNLLVRSQFIVQLQQTALTERLGDE
jgi:hypothetical protein